MAESILEKIKALYPEKFAPEEEVFSTIHRGDRIFIGTACGEPQYLVKALINYVTSHPKALLRRGGPPGLDPGVAPYTDQKFKHNFRHNSFFIRRRTPGQP